MTADSFVSRELHWNKENKHERRFLVHKEGELTC